MPKPFQRRRGSRLKRRAETAEESGYQNENESKRRKTSEGEFEESQDFIRFDNSEDANPDIQAQSKEWFGILDQTEQEYFKRADDMLELNQFSDETERSLFVENVYKEAEDKELKIAHSQSCSRLMERLIMLSTSSQLKMLFQKFSGHFLDMIQHRFASHCCEMLFVRCAPLVAEELTAPTEQTQQDMKNEDVYISMENLYLYTLDELEGNFGYLITNAYASHTLRILVLVLSGQALDKSEVKKILASKKKKNVSIGGKMAAPQELLTLEKRVVPESFSLALNKLIKDSIYNLDTTYLRALATHPTGSPILQAFLTVELNDKLKKRGTEEDSILKKLLPDDPLTKDSDSGKFVHGMLYDPAGSRLMEVIFRHAPGKIFKSIYKTFIKDRIAALSHNDFAGYVVMRALERLSKEDLEEAVHAIAPASRELIESGKPAVIRILIERCLKRGMDPEPISNELENVLKNHDILSSTNGDQNDGLDGHYEVQNVLLAQTMLDAPGSLSRVMYDLLLSKSPQELLELARKEHSSRFLQAALTKSTSTKVFRRQTVPKFYGSLCDLALDRAGSHVVDSLFDATHDLLFMREILAKELCNNESVLRDSYLGRAVWRNWDLDLYKRHMEKWAKLGKIEDKGLNIDNAPRRGIEEARKRFASRKEASTKNEKANKQEGTVHLRAIEKSKTESIKRKRSHRNRGATGANAEPLPEKHH